MKASQMGNLNQMSQLLKSIATIALSLSAHFAHGQTSQPHTQPPSAQSAQPTTPPSASQAPIARYIGQVRGTQAQCQLEVLSADNVNRVWSVRINPDGDGAIAPTFVVRPRPDNAKVLFQEIDRDNKISIRLKANVDEPELYGAVFFHGSPGGHGHAHSRNCINLVKVP